MKRKITDTEKAKLVEDINHICLVANQLSQSVDSLKADISKPLKHNSTLLDYFWLMGLYAALTSAWAKEARNHLVSLLEKLE